MKNVQPSDIRSFYRLANERDVEAETAAYEAQRAYYDTLRQTALNVLVRANHPSNPNWTPTDVPDTAEQTGRYEHLCTIGRKPAEAPIRWHGRW